LEDVGERTDAGPADMLCDDYDARKVTRQRVQDGSKGINSAQRAAERYDVERSVSSVGSRICTVEAGTHSEEGKIANSCYVRQRSLGV
jgi:hypothetical protein